MKKVILVLMCLVLAQAAFSLNFELNKDTDFTKERCLIKMSYADDSRYFVQQCAQPTYLDMFYSTHKVPFGYLYENNLKVAPIFCSN